MTDDIDDLAESIRRQADELWGHLPPDEVGEDDQLFFRTSSDGAIVVKVEIASIRCAMVPRGERVGCQMVPKKSSCGATATGWRTPFP
jgi:hypothetical protein